MADDSSKIEMPSQVSPETGFFVLMMCCQVSIFFTRK
jgi:hypothetical protein